MSNKSNFSAQGYKIETELETGNTNGKVIYKATQISTNLPVIIKEFQFARDYSTWSGYDAFCWEKEILKQLDHPSIPKYLDYFETNSSFCLVCEYKQGILLTNRIRFTPEQIKAIALALLEILIYLQQQPQPLIHGNIKPENILVDNSSGQIQVYLLDFSSAALLGQTSEYKLPQAISWFMPPEQNLNLGYSLATDLYSVGVTLVCLLTRTKSKDIGTLVDRNYRLNFKSLLRDLHPQFLRWLEKMTNPKQELRFKNAIAAYSSLGGINPSQTPLLIPATHKKSTHAFAVATFIAGFVTAVGALEYQSAFKPQNSLTAFNSSPMSISRRSCYRINKLGKYQGYINNRGDFHRFIRTNKISCADALKNCQLNATYNPRANIRCSWNNLEIFSTRDRY